MNLNTLLITTLILSATSFTFLRSECEECRKLRDELSKSWQSSLNFSREIRALADCVVKHSEAIRKMNGSL